MPEGSKTFQHGTDNRLWTLMDSILSIIPTLVLQIYHIADSMFITNSNI